MQDNTTQYLVLKTGYTDRLLRYHVKNIMHKNTSGKASLVGINYHYHHYDVWKTKVENNIALESATKHWKVFDKDPGQLALVKTLFETEKLCGSLIFKLDGISPSAVEKIFVENYGTQSDRCYCMRLGVADEDPYTMNRQDIIDYPGLGKVAILGYNTEYLIIIRYSDTQAVCESNEALSASIVFFKALKGVLGYFTRIFNPNY